MIRYEWLIHWSMFSHRPKGWLTHFKVTFHFDTPFKRQKTRSFLTFSGGLEIEHWLKWTKMTCLNSFSIGAVTCKAVKALYFLHGPSYDSFRKYVTYKRMCSCLVVCTKKVIWKDCARVDISKGKNQRYVKTVCKNE